MRGTTLLLAAWFLACKIWLCVVFFLPYVCVLQASRAGDDNMAKICSEKTFLNRQRLSRNTPDEELAVIENGDSRSDVAETLKLYSKISRVPFELLSLMLWLFSRILSLVLCFPHQGSLSLWRQLWDGAVLRDPQRLIYRCWGHGQVNWCGQTSKFVVGIYQGWRVHVLEQCLIVGLKLEITTHQPPKYV